MLRAIFRNKYGGELVVRGDIRSADIFVSESEGICVDLQYGDKPHDYIRVPVKDKMTAEGILRGATVSGLLDFTV